MYPESAQNTITKFHRTVSYSDIEHWRHACPVPCKQRSYIVEVKRFHQNHHADYDDTCSQDFLTNGAILELLYDSFAIREEVETLVYYFAEFSFKNNQCVTRLSQLKDVFRRRVK